MYELQMTTKFEKDLKLIKKQGKDIDKLFIVVETLQKGQELEPKYKDHNLIGNYKGYRECHIEPDLLLIYYKDNNKLILTLVRTGSHSNLF